MPSSAPAPAISPTPPLMIELDRQLRRLEQSGQLAQSGRSLAWVRRKAATLAPAIESAIGGALTSDRPAPPHPRERMPFVLVLPGVSPSFAVTTLRLGTRAGFLSADTSDIDRFGAIEGIKVPADLYAAIDVRRGDEHRGRTPDEAMAAFADEGRSPLTVSEGLALLTARPDALEKNHCFQTPGSRCGDRRVPGLWISARAPKLGFCWAGNRHSWLGIASCSGRVSNG